MTIALGATALASVLVAMPLGLAIATGGLAEATQPCAGVSESETSSAPQILGLDAEQLDNGRVIVETVQQRHLPTRAAVVAIATALQESSLRNLRDGDGDSLGLFQQRPSAGWGTPIQLLDPGTATQLFLDRLVEVPSWRVRPLTRVAQAVQLSGQPEAYAHWEETATQFVAAVLGRPRYRPNAVWPVQSGATSQPGPTEVAFTTATGDLGCVLDSGVEAGCGFAPAKENPRSCRDAMRWAVAMTDGPPTWSRRCLNFVAQAYGYRASGIETAADFWVAATDRFAPIPQPPAGALVFWATNDPAGHVALSLGDGMVVSNDVTGPGVLSVVPLAEIGERWGAYYLGWAPPYFPNAV